MLKIKVKWTIVLKPSLNLISQPPPPPTHSLFDHFLTNSYKNNLLRFLALYHKLYQKKGKNCCKNKVKKTCPWAKRKSTASNFCTAYGVCNLLYEISVRCLYIYIYYIRGETINKAHSHKPVVQYILPVPQPLYIYPLSTGYHTVI